MTQIGQCQNVIFFRKKNGQILLNKSIKRTFQLNKVHNKNKRKPNQNKSFIFI